MRETLNCQAGHTWTREAKRGRKPTACPEHHDLLVPETPKVTKIVAAKEVLHCEAGHEWTRTPTRGRKPRWCPEHQPQVEPKAPRRQKGEKRNITTDTSRAIIREELNRPRIPRCRCGITEEMTLTELIGLGAGCTAGRWVCPTLDAIRRRYPGR